MALMRPGGEENYRRFHDAHSTAFMRDVLLDVCRELDVGDRLTDDFAELRFSVPWDLRHDFEDVPVSGRWLDATFIKSHRWDRSCGLLQLDCSDGRPDDVPADAEPSPRMNAMSLKRLKRLVSDDLSHQIVSHRIVFLLPVDGEEDRHIPTVISGVDCTESRKGLLTHLTLELVPVLELDQLERVFQPPYYGHRYG